MLALVDGLLFLLEATPIPMPIEAPTNRIEPMAMALTLLASNMMGADVQRSVIEMG